MAHLRRSVSDLQHLVRDLRNQVEDLPPPDADEVSSLLDQFKEAIASERALHPEAAAEEDALRRAVAHIQDLESFEEAIGLSD
jgi:hypothetical protein